MHTRELLIEAMKNLRMVNFTYENQPIRRVAPHAIYISSANCENLDAFQFDGYSKTQGLPDWRNFKLSKIQNLEITDENFVIETARGYKRYSNKYNRSVYKV